MSTEPQTSVGARWQVCSPATVGDFSAVGYFFARELQRAVDVPIGLIRAAVGGSPITGWCAPELLASEPALKSGLDAVETLRAQVRAGEVGETHFKGVVERWWQANDPGTRDGWALPETDASAWARLAGADAAPGFDGVTWCRLEVDLPADWAGRDLSLFLTGIWEPDTVWFNGTLVGAFDQGWINRTSKVPGALVKAGRNVIAQRVIAQPGRGYRGPAPISTLALAGQPDTARALDGPRRLRQSVPTAALPAFPHRLDNDFQLPTVLHHGMIAPLTPFALRGALWYQGETPCPGGQEVHRRLLTALAGDWRRQFRSPEAWFLIVQLPVLGGAPTSDPNNTGCAAIRAVQWEVGHSLANADTACITDLGDPRDIHPKNKQDVGHRLALIAQARLFGQAVEYSGPTARGATVEADGEVRLSFDHLGGGLEVRGGALEGFALAGADRRFVWAEARLDGDQVVVRAGRLVAPVWLRYDFVDVPRYRLWNKAGLPAPPLELKLVP